jgi:hypothetical protein
LLRLRRTLAVDSLRARSISKNSGDPKSMSATETAGRTGDPGAASSVTAGDISAADTEGLLLLLLLPPKLLRRLLLRLLLALLALFLLPALLLVVLRGLARILVSKDSSSKSEKK